MTELLERLGRPADPRLVIITAQGMGQSHSTTAACYEALRDGIATAASAMVPCPWGRAAAIDGGSEDVGVCLTLNAEYDRYRWGPITRAPSLLDGDGGFPRTVVDMWDHADLEEVRRECRAQIERAVLWGIDVSHLSDYLGALQNRPEFFDVYLELALEFGLPIRLGTEDSERNAGFRFRELARSEGAVFPDHVVTLSLPNLKSDIAALAPGVTEFSVRPGIDSAELRAVSDNWQGRVSDSGALHAGSDFDAALKDAGVERIGWRPLKSVIG